MVSNELRRVEILKAQEWPHKGTMFEDGKGAPQSNEEAVRWYQKAVDLGYADALCKLRDKCAGGLGAPQSHEKAPVWYGHRRATAAVSPL